MLPPNSGWLPTWATPRPPRKVYDIPPVITREPRRWPLHVLALRRGRGGA